jgi:hypothetical protein
MNEIETHAYEVPKLDAYSASRDAALLEQKKGEAQRKVMGYETDPTSMSEDDYNYYKGEVNYFKEEEYRLSQATPGLTDIDSVEEGWDFVKGTVGGMVGTYKGYAQNIGDVYQNKVHAMIADMAEEERTPENIDNAKAMAALSLGMDVPLPLTGLLGGVVKGVGKSAFKGVALDVAEDFATNAVQAAAEESGRNREVTAGDAVLAGVTGVVGGTVARVPAKAIGEAKNRVFAAAVDPNTSTGKVVEGVKVVVNNVYGRRHQNQENIFVREGNTEGVKFHRDVRENIDIERKVQLAKSTELKKESMRLFKTRDLQMVKDYLNGNRTDLIEEMKGVNKVTSSRFSPEQLSNLDKWRKFLDDEHTRAEAEGHGTWHKNIPQWNADGTPQLHPRGKKKGQQKTAGGRVLKKVDGYLPITPDAKTLVARFDEAVADLVADPQNKYDVETAKKVIQGYIDADKKGFVPDSRSVIKQLKEGVPPKKVAGRPRGNSNLDQSRMINASQAWQSKYSNANIFDALGEWGKRRAHTVAMDKYVGPDGAKLAKRLGMVGEIQNGKGMTPINPKYFGEVADSIDLYDRGVGASLTPGNRRILSTLKSIANVMYLPLTALSSLTETFNLGTKVNNLIWAQAQVKAIGSIGHNMMAESFKGVPKAEVHKQLALAGRAWDTSTDQMASRLDDGGMTKGMEWFNDKFFKLTLQSPINYINNVAAVHAMQAQIKNDINIMGKESGHPRYKAARARLEDLGIDVDDSAVVSAFKTRSGAIYEEMMPYVINRFTRDIVLNPTVFDKPAWSSTGWMSMFSQLQGYPMMWASQVFPRMVAQATGAGKGVAEDLSDKANLAMTVSAMVLISYLQESMKAEIRGQEKSDEEMFVIAIERAALPYQLGNMRNAIMGKHGGFESMIFGAPGVSILDDIMGNMRHAIKGDLSLENAVFFKQFKDLY